MLRVSPADSTDRSCPQLDRSPVAPDMPGGGGGVVTGPLHRRQHRMVLGVHVGEDPGETGPLRRGGAGGEQVVDVTIAPVLGEHADVGDRRRTRFVERRDPNHAHRSPVALGDEPRVLGTVGILHHLGCPVLGADTLVVPPVVAIERPLGDAGEHLGVGRRADIGQRTEPETPGELRPSRLVLPRGRLPSLGTGAGPAPRRGRASRRAADGSPGWCVSRGFPARCRPASAGRFSPIRRAPPPGPLPRRWRRRASSPMGAASRPRPGR